MLTRLKVALNSCILLIYLIALLCCFGTLLGFLGEYHWLIDLASHFRFFYALVLATAIFFCLIFPLPRYQRVLKWGLFSCLMINAALILPYMLKPESDKQVTTVQQETSELRVMQSNVWASNLNLPELSLLIQTFQPDILALEETTPRIDEALKQQNSFKNLPYRLYDATSNLALYSRFPFKGSIELTDGLNNNFLVGHFTINQQPMTVLVCHPDRPNKGHEKASAQLYSFEKMLKTIRQFQNTSAMIVMGDFNTTPWSHAYRYFVSNSNLKDSEQGFGIQPSYPVYFPHTSIRFPMTLLPIDHVFVSPDIHITERKLGRNVGSDHLPLLLRLRLTESKATQVKINKD